MPFHTHLSVFKVAYEQGYEGWTDTIFDEGFYTQSVALSGVGLLPVYEHAEYSIDFTFGIVVHTGEDSVQ